MTIFPQLQHVRMAINHIGGIEANGGYHGVVV